MRHVFIVNPASGRQNPAQTLLPHIIDVASEYTSDSDVRFTEYKGHASELAALYGEQGDAARVYAVGGDGTLNEVLNGAYPFQNLEVAHIPCGSGNDFIRSFGTTEDFLDIEGQIKGTAIPIDLMEVDGGICAAITSTGLDAEVAYNIPKYRRIPLLGGSMAYNISILEKLLKPLGKQLRIVLDGREMEGKYLIATVCNAGHYGGGYNAAPMASLEDGTLDVILVKKISRLLIAGIIGKYKKGMHYQNGSIAPKLQKHFQYFTAKRVEIYPTGSEPFILNVDGECGPAPRLYAKVMPAAARFVLPQKLCAGYRAKVTE